MTKRDPWLRTVPVHAKEPKEQRRKALLLRTYYLKPTTYTAVPTLLFTPPTFYLTHRTSPQTPSQTLPV